MQASTLRPAFSQQTWQSLLAPSTPTLIQTLLVRGDRDTECCGYVLVKETAHGVVFEFSTEDKVAENPAFCVHAGISGKRGGIVAPVVHPLNEKGENREVMAQEVNLLIDIP
ncbi:hypothetical protein HG531_007135 [Fusarium graminearum]|nr:hypothetical protein HG531_007135 [Fusarium graminearum]